MKKLNLVALMVALVFMASVSVNATSLKKEFKNYKINKVDKFTSGNEGDKAWVLTYSSNGDPITVIKKQSSNGANYIVRSDNFEVSYLSGNKGFGATDVKAKWRKVDRRISYAVINQDELKRQKVLTLNKVDDDYALGLIANYLPLLVNENYRHLLN